MRSPAHNVECGSLLRQVRDSVWIRADGQKRFNERGGSRKSREVKRPPTFATCGADFRAATNKEARDLCMTELDG